MPDERVTVGHLIENGRALVTVGQLIEALRDADPDTPVWADYDSRCAGGDLVAVEVDAEGSGCVVLVID